MKKIFINSLILATSLRELWEKGPCGKYVAPSGDELPPHYEESIWTAICNLLGNGIYWLMIVAGVLAVFFVMWGGYTMLTAGGDTSKIEQGKKTILWAIIGVAVVALARFAINLLIKLIKPSVDVPNI